MIGALGEIYWWLYHGAWAGISLETMLNTLGVAPESNPNSWWNRPTKWIGIHKILQGIGGIGLAAPLWLWTGLLWMWVGYIVDELDYELKFGRPRRRRRSWDRS